MRRWPWIALAAAVAAAGGALWFAMPRDIAIRADDAGSVARGQSVYTRHCASCHGERLEGQPDWQSRKPDGRLPAPPHDATGHTWHHPDRVLFEITKYGVAKAANLPGHPSNMPAYEGILSDADIVAVLSWIKAQWPEPIRKQQEEVNAAQRRR